MGKVLIIDDDHSLGPTIGLALERMDHETKWATTIGEGLEAASRGDFDVVLLDVRLPDGDGLAALPEIQKASPLSQVIIMTGFGDADGAELAIKSGAWDYLQKPISLKEMKLALSRALDYQKERKTRGQALKSMDRRGIIGDSQPLRECLDLLAQAASGELNVLLTGETGTGKERFALAIHKNGVRADKNFVVVDCAALPKTLVESTLFGHEKGAYTGADRAKDGLIKQADGGTLFLDEIGELPLEIQKKFLRVLQERTFRPVGGKNELRSDFRLVAATNRNLDDMVEQGTFREDLVFRLKAMVIALPPLRKRPEDIKPLTLHYVAKLCERFRIEVKGFSPDFFDVLEAYDWPGNVRELNQALEKALASAGESPILYTQDLPAEIRAKAARRNVKDSDAPPPPQGGHYKVMRFPNPLPSLEEVRGAAVHEVIKRYLQELMRQTEGNLKEARRIAGLSRSRLYTLMKDHGVAGPHDKEDVDSD